MTRLAARAAAAGLQTHHSRTSASGRGRLEPADWQPATYGELVAARSESWQLLLSCFERVAHNESVRDEIWDLIANNTRAAVTEGVLEDVERDVRGRTWAPPMRAALAAALRDVRRYDEPPEDVDATLASLIDHLEGSTFRDRIELLFQSKPWDLQEGDDYVEIPPAIQRLGDEVAANPSLLGDALVVAPDAPDDGSRFPFFAYVADKLGAKKVGLEALTTEPPTWIAAAAAMARADGQGEGEWVDEVLATSKDRADWRPMFPRLLRVVRLTPNRAQLAQELVEQGVFSGRDFAELLYGAPIPELGREQAMALVKMVGSDDDPRALEAALGMFDQWLDTHQAEIDGVAEIAAFLAERAAAVPESAQNSMLTYYLARLLRETRLPFEAKADVWRARVHKSGISLRHEEHPLVDDLIEEDSERAADVIFEVLLEAVNPPYQKWAYSLEDYKLLSRLGAATSGEAIWERLAQRSDTELRFLLRHTAWGGEKPDPVVRAFLVSDRREKLEDEASVNFFNSLGIVTGPYYLGLERELERARHWLDDLRGTSAEAWAKDLVEEYEHRVPAQKLLEEEEDLDLR